MWVIGQHWTVSGKPFDPTVPPRSDTSAARRINRILRERNAPKTTKKAAVVPGIVAQPSGLEPIHIREDPLLKLSIEDQVFCRNSGARNIIKPLQLDLADYKPKFRSQPVNKKGPPLPQIRQRSVFVDDPAIESDGEGEEIPLGATNPSNSRSSSPTPTVGVKKVIVKKPRQNSTCKDCNKTFSGRKQLNVHLKSKCHKRASSGLGILVLIARLATYFFQSAHDLRHHNCQ